jgi:hypothetical protein
VFGSCPRVYCVGCNVVPCGRVDIPGNDIVKLYCPNCNDIYIPPSSRFQGVDGTYSIQCLVGFFTLNRYRKVLSLGRRSPICSSRRIGNGRQLLSGKQLRQLAHLCHLGAHRAATALLHGSLLSSIRTLTGVRKRLLVTCMCHGYTVSRSARGPRVVQDCSG